MGDNGGPPLEDPPPIPEEEPSTTKARNAILKSVAKWALRAAALGAEGPLGDVIAAVQTALWLYDKYSYLKAYLDDPKSLDELRQNAADPQKGYEIHHIVEQKSAGDDGFPKSRIDAPENLVRISTLKHWEISGWYSKGNKKYEGLSPREYLRGKGWEERESVGLQALRDSGVLKP